MRINIHEAKTHLSRYAKRVKAGETVVLCDRNKPFAEIRPLGDDSHRGTVKIGVAKGQFRVPDGFDEPVDEFEADFYGNGGSGS